MELRFESEILETVRITSYNRCKIKVTDIDDDRSLIFSVTRNEYPPIIEVQGEFSDYEKMIAASIVLDVYMTQDWM